MSDAPDLLPGLVPGHALPERELLLSYLARQRALVRWKLAGLSDDDARAVATSTGLTVHGIVRHLTHVERVWLRERFAGETDLSYDWTDDDPDGDLHVPLDVTLESLLDDYAAESQRCDAVVAGADLDATAALGGHSLRWLVLHLVEETARHLGHLDLLCELADGRTGEEPEDETTTQPPGEA